MKKSIWKFQLNINDEIFIEMPKDSEILSVQIQKGTPCMWVLVNPDAPKERRCFEIFGTGHPIHCSIETKRKFIDSFQMNGGDLVFHLFEKLA